LAAQIQTDENSIKTSTHQLLSNNAQYTCLAAQIQTDENSTKTSTHQLLSNNEQYTCLAAQIQTDENSIIPEPNIVYNNYLHEQHINDTDHQKMSPNIPNKLLSTLSFQNINISDMNKSFGIFTNSNAINTIQQYHFHDPPTSIQKKKKCYKSKLKENPTP
jgi:hypothetical protein